MTSGYLLPKSPKTWCLKVTMYCKRISLAGLFSGDGNKLAMESSQGLSELGISDGFFADISGVSALLGVPFISSRAVSIS